MLRVIIRIAISIMALLPFLLHNVGILRLGFIERIENMAYDARLVLTLPQSLDDRIVIVDVEKGSALARHALPEKSYEGMVWAPYKSRWSPDGRRIPSS